MNFSAIARIWERAVFILLAVLTLFVLFEQARVLYIFPQPDSARWWGDETGQMLELRAELQDGYARIPTGLGSSVAITNGLVRGNSWLAAAIYGVPVILFSRDADVVTVGRTVTFILSAAMLLALFLFLRAMSVPRLLATLALLLLTTTRSFFFSSHAARLDIAAGLVLILYAWYFTTRYERFRSGDREPGARWYFGYGIIAILLATLSIHLLTLIGALSLYILWRFRTYRRPAFLFAALGGVIVMFTLLISIYALSGTPVSLFGPSSASNQFQGVAAGLPILRPLSRSVQVANLLERFHGLWAEAPAFLVLLAMGVIFKIAIRRSQVLMPREGWLLGAAFVVAIGWLLFESPALYYYVQVLPLLIAALITMIAARLRINLIFSVIIGIAGVCLSYFAMRDTAQAASISKILEQDNHIALQNALNTIEEDWHSNARPTVLAQNPAIDWLDHDPRVQLMTAHLVSFPVSNAPIAGTLRALGVNYVILYAAHDGNIYSADERVLRPIADSVGTILFRQTGTLFDVHRDYFSPPVLNDTLPEDTLILYKLPSSVR